jgi:hypothetical protein
MNAPNLPDRIEYRRFACMKPDNRNANHHDADQITNIVTIIAELSRAAQLPVAADCESIAGHCRILAAALLSLPEVPVAQIVANEHAGRRYFKAELDLVGCNVAMQR